MKSVTNNFNAEIKKMGKQQTIEITYTSNDQQVILDDDVILSAKRVYEGSLLKSIMVELDIESMVAIPKDTEINYRYGLLVNGSYEYINYGRFVVYEVNKKEDARSYEIKCYDKMIYAMKDYEALTIAYPCTILEYVSALAVKLGFMINLSNFANLSQTIPTELYENLGYTYRDVLDEISQALGCTMYIQDTGIPTLMLGRPNYSGYTVNEEQLKDVNVNFGEKYGPINSIILSRAGESDNVYRQDEESIEENGLCELKIVDNQIMNFNNRADFLPGLASELFGIEYYLNDYSSTGIMILDLLDYYNVQIGENTYKCLMLNDEQNITQGLEELVYTERPVVSETDYTKADKTDQRINQTYIIVDKQNQAIESVVSTVGEQNTKISRIEQTVDELNSKISDIADITTSQETMTGRLVFTDINESEPIYVRIYPISENISYLYPFNLLYPANNLYIKIRTLRFTNTDTNEVFDYELPDDLLYYDGDNYDEFILDYEAQKVYVNKKCKYNTSTGVVELLATARTDEYTFPYIPLTSGDYTVEMLKYDNTVYNCYLMCRLMAQNIYTTQFAVKSEVNTQLQQTATSINASVDQKLTNYSTTTEMNSAINLSAQGITTSVSNTYATKNELNTAKSEIQQTTDGITSTVSSVQQQTNTNTSNISTLQQTTQGLTSTVSQKVGNNEVISKINQSSESITIDANRISLTRENNKYDK